MVQVVNEEGDIEFEVAVVADGVFVGLVILSVCIREKHLHLTFHILFEHTTVKL